MRIEMRDPGDGRDGRAALLDEEGVEVVRGDPLCVGGLTFYFGWIERPEPIAGEPDGPMVALLKSPGAAAWKRLVPAGDPELHRGPSVADEADARLYGQRVPLPGVTYQ